MRNKIYNAILAIFLLSIVSCGEIIDANLGKDELKLIAPADSLLTTSSDITFLWNSNEDATSYRIQLARPSFRNLEEIVLDSLISEDNIHRKLKVGKYSWRVQAKNSSTSTKYALRSFEIVKDLKSETVVIVLPTEGYKTTSKEMLIKWDALYGAESYKLEIASPSFSQVKKIVLDTLVVDHRLTKELPIGKYELRIKARNIKTESKYFRRGFEIE